MRCKAIRRALCVAVLAAVPLAVAPSGAQAFQVTFASSGAEDSWLVPSGVTTIDVTAVGAAGGIGFDTPVLGGSGGAGAAVTGTLSVVPGTTLFIDVGGSPSNLVAGGFNGGGAPAQYGAGGGGATDLRTIPRGDLVNSLPSRLIVAGGGGGGGGVVLGGAGGDAGLAGMNGVDTAPSAMAGEGGSPGVAGAGGAGGAGGFGDLLTGGPGGDGALGVGGTSGAAISGGGGGGGGGLYGGGAGGTGGRNSGSQNAPGGGGGGGSSLVPIGGTIASAGSAPASLTITYGGLGVTLSAPVALGPDRALLLASAEGRGLAITSHFEYGLDAGYGTSTPDSTTSASTAFASAVVGGLAPDTTYHYRLVVTDSGGATAESPDSTFTTLPAAPTGATAGPAGSPGAPGATGAPGAAGAAGARGPAGPPGRVRRDRPTIHLASARVQIGRRNRVALRLTCSETARACHVRVVVRRVGSKFFRRSVRIRPGRSVRVHVRVTRSMRAALLEKRAQRVKVTLTGLSGTAIVQRTSNVLIRPR